VVRPGELESLVKNVPQQSDSARHAEVVGQYSVVSWLQLVSAACAENRAERHCCLNVFVAWASQQFLNALHFSPSSGQNSFVCVAQVVSCPCALVSVLSQLETWLSGTVAQQSRKPLQFGPQNFSH
jgi:hypothetical protein